MTDEVLLQVADGIAIITLNRPTVRNAVDGALAAAMVEALDTIEADPAIRVGVLTGQGTAFCAGADLRALDEALRAGVPNGLHQKRGGFAGLVRRDRTKPMIAAVNGPAYAGGFEMVLACDLVIATAQATFALPEVKRSLIASAGGLFRLPRIVGLNRAMELILTAEPIDCRRAWEIGIVNHMVDHPEALLPAALQMARTIADNAPLAVAASRALAINAFDSRDDELFRAGFAAANTILRSSDAAEGRRAFLEKRPPRWQGR